VFIRYNQLAKYFEYDASGGLGAGPWIKLEIDASQIIGSISSGQLPANVAYKNIDNAFVAQTLYEGTVIQGPNLQFLLKATSAPVDKGLWRWITYGDGLIRLEALNDAMSVLISSVNFDRNGNIAVVSYYEQGRGTPLGHWANWNPVWTANVAPGPTNGIITGAYTLIGKTCHFRVRLTMQASTTYGPANNVWAFGFPFPAYSGYISRDVIGSAHFLGSNIRTGSTVIYDTNYWMVAVDLPALVGHYVGSDTPWTWGSGFELEMNGTYQVA
jgi:hypothetical protein